MFRSCTTILALIAPAKAFACDLALMLAVDVSGSVDPQEYRIQMDGLAAALRDGIVADALVDQQAQVALIQWTGSSRQRQTIPWTAMRSYGDVLALADRIEADPRIWRNYSTAIGEALEVARDSFEPVAHCMRKVIDVSGDGESNEGVEPATQRSALRASDITVNAIAIETDDGDLTAYFYENLITGPGAFVVTANGFADYPEQIRRKLQRETSRQVTSIVD
ncbi:DUF1194 domain-containing protein [Tateyamaria armeniaca]|uniref:DUF1194 domain-containing protein n=1 Tax=Tateyamaria armeniaca TaxID=2518930 RepID=A0ABW8UNA1_9RHOB